MNRVKHDNEPYKDLLEAVANSNVQEISTSLGDVYLLGCCVEIYFLWPDTSTQAGPKARCK